MWSSPAAKDKNDRKENLETEETPLIRPISAPSDIKGISNDQVGKRMSFAELRQFYTLAAPFFRENRSARCTLAVLIVLCLMDSGSMVVFSYCKRDIFDALNDKDESKFYTKLVTFFLILLIAVPITVLYDFWKRTLALRWRESLTKRIVNRYYENRTYFILETTRDIDNPDQRISEDISSFTTVSLTFCFIIINALISLFAFSVVLFQIYPYLFLAIIIYALLGTLITARLGRSLVGLYFSKLQKEADFRFGLIRTRENAEAIAFYDPIATSEKNYIWKLFGIVVQNASDIIRTQRNLETFTTTYDYITYVIPLLVIAPLYFQGKVDLGSITQASEAFYVVRSR